MKKLKYVYFFFAIFALVFGNCIANTTAEEARKLSIDNEKDKKIINEEINKIASKIGEVDNKISNVRLNAAKNAGFDVSMDFIKEMETEGCYSFSDEEGTICNTIENTTKEEIERLKNDRNSLEEEMEKFFVNDRMIELEKEYNDKKAKQESIRLETVKKVYPKFTENDLEKIKTYHSMPSTDKRNGKFLTKKERKYYDLYYYYLYNQMKANGVYDEYENLGKRMDEINRKEMQEEREKARISLAADIFENTGEIPSWAQGCYSYKVLHASKKYNDSKPSFSLFFDFSDGNRFIIKNKKLYRISNSKEEPMIDNIDLEVETNIFYSAIFDKQNQVIYIYQDIVLEPVDKRDFIFTIDLKNKKLYLFEDHLPFFAKFYLYNNQLFATGQNYHKDEESVLTYAIKNDKADLIDGDNGIKLKYVKNNGFYKVESVDFGKKDVIFLHDLSYNKKKMKNPVKLLDNKTNKLYSLKCGYMYSSYYWGKSYFNATGSCNSCGGPFGELDLEYEAFIYNSKEKGKIYSGCSGDRKEAPESIDEFCKDIDE